MHSRGHKNAMGALLFGLVYRHGGADTELPGFITGSRYDPAVRGPADDNAFVLEPRVIQLLYRGIKSIHVNMQDHLILDFGLKRFADRYGFKLNFQLHLLIGIRSQVSVVNRNRLQFITKLYYYDRMLTDSLH
jgi:hypothetical protein